MNRLIKCLFVFMVASIYSYSLLAQGGKLEQRTVSVEVNKNTLKLVDNWSSGIMVFTSEVKPIRTLKDVVDKHGIIGIHHPFIFELIPKVQQLFESEGIPIHEGTASSWKWKLHVEAMSEEYFPTVFKEDDSNLLFFVAVINNEQQEKALTTKGNGIRIKFVERK